MKLAYDTRTEKMITITPEIARLFLDNNYPKNRSLRASTVVSYASDMREGRWNPELSIISEPIVFNTEGKMTNGQHRCHACIVSNSTIVSKVIFGVYDPDGVLYNLMDSGCPRRAADALDVPNANSIASIAKVYIALKEGSAPLMSSLQGKISIGRYGRASADVRVTRSQIAEYVNSNLDYFEKIHTLGRKLASPFGRSRGTFCDFLTIVTFVGRDDCLESFVLDFSSNVPKNPTIIACKSHMTQRFISRNFDTSTRWIIGTLLNAYENYRKGKVTGSFNKVDTYISEYDKYVDQARKGATNG